jgi:hypothetical protein
LFFFFSFFFYYSYVHTRLGSSHQQLLSAPLAAYVVVTFFFFLNFTPPDRCVEGCHSVLKLLIAEDTVFSCVCHLFIFFSVMSPCH